MPPTDRSRDHTGQGAATTVAAHRVRRRLRADRARQLADLLRHQLLTGAFENGTLPHESTLATDYRASRNTVRQALDLLRAEGLVERLPGVGTVVVAEKYPHGLDRLMGLAETLREHGRVTNEVRTLGPAPAPAPVAERLRVPAGADVLYIERLRRLNGLPLSLDPGCPAPLVARAVAALSDPAWQVRSGAATALSVAPADSAVPALAKALADPNPDVRKAAVLALTRHNATEQARAALATATTDSDADVRAYAARGL
ncbi:GntR family transcriptional regulator [Streptomyces sp. NPDC017958]|uniref:GntR family transcriptional regulator n=1 Tax=Streptomyces sp. NPDC017958 TaxID=3365021 RepID=UPI003788352E